MYKHNVLATGLSFKTEKESAGYKITELRLSQAKKMTKDRLSNAIFCVCGFITHIYYFATFCTPVTKKQLKNSPIFFSAP